MIYFFKYNWMVRDEYFSLLKNVPTHELTQKRTGGLGNILVTLFHIIEVEHNWISDLKGVPILDLKFSAYENNLNGLIELSQKLQSDIQEYLEQWDDRLAFQELKITEDWGQVHCTYGEVLRHIIAHEVHHIGQLSIWMRVLGIEPPSANFIHRGIMLNPDPK
jgi:uncharacterized damage-inducible protein DinB